MIDDYPIYIWSCPDSLPAPINIPGYISTMPDISPSGDTLFFCSNRPGTRGGSDIWISIKTDSIWSEPINLGDSINTPADEYAPDYSPASGILFFDRFDVPSQHSLIFSSQKLEDSTFSQASALPQVVNIPGHDNFGPTYDENRQALYYSSPAGLDTEPVYRSYYSNGEWGIPEALSDSVNGYPYHLCSYGITENPDITASGAKFFYNTMIGGGICIDYNSELFYSEALPDAIEETGKGKSTSNLNVYPNPSNSSFTFQISGKDEQYTINIFNINGQLIKRLATISNAPIAWHGLNEAGEPVSSGVYFAIVKVNGQNLTKKIALLK